MGLSGGGNTKRHSCHTFTPVLCSIGRGACRACRDAVLTIPALSRRKVAVEAGCLMSRRSACTPYARPSCPPVHIRLARLFGVYRRWLVPFPSCSSSLRPPSPSPLISSFFYRDGEPPRRGMGSRDQDGERRSFSFRFVWVGARGPHPRMSSYNIMARFAAMSGTFEGVSSSPHRRWVGERGYAPLMTVLTLAMRFMTLALTPTSPPGPAPKAGS